MTRAVTPAVEISTLILDNARADASAVERTDEIGRTDLTPIDEPETQGRRTRRMPL